MGSNQEMRSNILKRSTQGIRRPFFFFLLCQESARQISFSMLLFTSYCRVLQNIVYSIVEVCKVLWILHANAVL